MRTHLEKKERIEELNRLIKLVPDKKDVLQKMIATLEKDLDVDKAEEERLTKQKSTNKIDVFSLFPLEELEENLKNRLLRFRRNSLARGYRDSHLIFAAYAAFSQLSSPDFLNKLWVNFTTYKNNKEQIFKINPVVVSDLVQSDLLEHRGGELFAMPNRLREAFLKFLKKLQNKDSFYEVVSFEKLASFLLNYFKVNGVYNTHFSKDQVDYLEWIALTYLKPSLAVKKVADAINNIQNNKQNVVTERIRLGLVSETLRKQEQIIGTSNIVSYENAKNTISTSNYFKELANTSRGWINIYNGRTEEAMANFSEMHEGDGLIDIWVPSEIEGKKIAEISSLMKSNSDIVDKKDDFFTPPLSQMINLENSINKSKRKKKLKNRLHALLIGINNYHPDSGIPPLNGCVNDINNFKKFLFSNYADSALNIRTLLNEEATRENIIKNFQKNIIERAREGDTVFFYFSGYGSQEMAASEFRHDSNNIGDTLVSYNSRLEGHFDLADIELKILFSRIKEGVKTVAFFDCSYSLEKFSSSGFDATIQRSLNSRYEERKLSDYLLDNYFEDLFKQTGSVNLPISKHLQFLASQANQSAMETKDEQGVFSSTLLKVLNENAQISYSELFDRLNVEMRHLEANQTPVLFIPDGFDPNTIILSLDVKENSKRFKIVHNEGNWHLELGAVHGLPTNDDYWKNILVGIYSSIESNKLNKLVAQSFIDSLHLKECILNFKGDAEMQYIGEIQNYPSSKVINLVGEKKVLSEFRKKYSKKTSPFIQFIENSEIGIYTLEVYEDKLLIKLTENNQLIHGREEGTTEAVEYIVEILDSIIQWERLTQLTNDSTDFKEEDIEVVFIDESDEANPVEIQDRLITLNLPQVGKDKVGDLIANYYTIKARNNTSQKLYIALIHLNSDYTINTHSPCSEILPSSDWFILDNQHGLVIPDKEANEVTDIFKILISTESFDDFKFERKSFEQGVIISKSERDSVTRSASMRRRKAEQDWFTHTITVTTFRKQEIQQFNDVKSEIRNLIANGQLDKAMEELKRASNKHLDEITSLQNQLADLDKEKRLGLKSHSEGNLKRSKITHAMLELVKEIEETGFPKNEILNDKVYSTQIFYLTFEKDNEGFERKAIQFFDKLDIVKSLDVDVMVSDKMIQFIIREKQFQVHTLKQLNIFEQELGSIGSGWLDDTYALTIEGIFKEKGGDLSNLVLNGLDFSEKILDKINFKNTLLRGVNLSTTSLMEADFTGADLQRANFSRADLHFSRFENTNFSKANFTASRLNQSTFIKSNGIESIFKDANLVRASISNTTFYGATLEKIDFSGTSFDNVNFKGANLEKADFNKAVLVDCDFSDTKNLVPQQFENAVLKEGNVGLDFRDVV